MLSTVSRVDDVAGFSAKKNCILTSDVCGSAYVVMRNWILDPPLAFMDLGPDPDPDPESKIIGLKKKTI